MNRKEKMLVPLTIFITRSISAIMAKKIVLASLYRDLPVSFSSPVILILPLFCNPTMFLQQIPI